MDTGGIGLRVAEAEWARLWELCRAQAPLEACGLLIGRWEGAPGQGARGERARAEGAQARLTRIVPAPNILASPDRFEIDPAVHFAVLRELRAQEDLPEDQREILLGSYHSHPKGSAILSAQDRAMAWDQSLIWLILALAPPDPAEPASAWAYQRRGEDEGEERGEGTWQKIPLIYEKTP